MVEITIKTPSQSGSFFDPFWAIVDNNRPEHEQLIRDLLEKTADNDHVYTTRTGNLEDATMTKGGLESEINLYVDSSIADYGIYVVGYTSDNFIQNSLDSNRDEIMRIMENLYSTSIAEFNR